jgi:AraC family transcriptional regulator of adaptative response / DNA-3-methyladenine glycosylase II
LLEENCGSGQNLKEFIQRLGCSDRHLRRAFIAEYKVSPLQYLQTCRLLLAKNLLTDTELSVTDVAMAAGFGSLRRFNGLFKKQYRLAPSALRRQAAHAKGSADNVTLALGYRPPYPWRQMLDFLTQRAIPGVEIISNDSYLRTVHFVSGEQKDVFGWIRVSQRPQNNTLAVTVDSALLPVLAQVLARVRHLFDLYCAPDAVYETLSAMNKIRPGLCVPGTRLPGCVDPFETAVRAVLGQQITVKAAGTLARRLAETYGTPVETGIDGLTRAFPSPKDILALNGSIADHLGPLGVTGTRARAIAALAEIIVQGELDLNLCAQPEPEIRKLMAIPGIGAWTAQYIAMRAMGWPDAFPHTDYGVKKALAPRTESEILKMAEAWRPWRSYATVHLWNSLKNH